MKEILHTENLMENIDIMIKSSKVKLNIYDYLNECDDYYNGFKPNKDSLYEGICEILDDDLL
mgnify:CR=1 FL=1